MRVPSGRKEDVLVLVGVMFAGFACGKGASSRQLTCSSTSSGFSVTLSDAALGTGSLHNCTFDSLGRPTKMTVTFASGEIATCSGLQYIPGQVSRATCWTSDGKNSCVVPATGSPDPFDSSFSWGCRSPSYEEPGFVESCVWNRTMSTIAGPPPTASNSVDLQGGAFGAADFDTPSFRKTVPVKILNPVAGLVVEPGVVIRDDATSENSKVVLTVKNQGASGLCNLAFLGFRWLDATGSVPAALKDKYPYASIYGSLTRGPTGDIVSGCLRVGEVGFLLDSGSAFSDVAAVELDLGSQTLPAGETPVGLVPESYDIGVCGTVPSYRAKVRNAGTSSVWLESGGWGGWVIALDAVGNSIGAGGLGSNRPQAIAPGETIDLIGSMGHTAPGDRLRIFTTFSSSF